jgi:hypothetical protein
MTHLPRAKSVRKSGLRSDRADRYLGNSSTQLKPTANIGTQGERNDERRIVPIRPFTRSLLAGLAATPALAATTEPSPAQAVGRRWTPQQAQAALKDAKGTKLVLLGTAAGSKSGLMQCSKIEFLFNQLIGALLKRHWYG